MTDRTPIYSSRGRVLKMAQETALGAYTEADFEGATEANGGAIYCDGDLKFPTTNVIGADNPNTTHAMWSNITDQPVGYKTYLKDGFVLPYRIRGQKVGTAGTEVPPIVRFFESAGCTHTHVLATNSTIDAGTTETSIVGVGDVANKGAGLLAGLGTANADGYWPAIVCSESPAKTYVPWMALPSAPALANHLSSLHVIYPNTDEVAAAKSIAFRMQNRGDYSTSPDNTYTASGCVLSKVAPFKLTPLGIPQMDFTFHVCKVENEAEAAFIDGVHLDSSRFAPPFGTTGGLYRARCGMRTHVKTGALATLYAEFSEAEIDLGINTTVVEGSGSVESLYGAFA